MRGEIEIERVENFWCWSIHLYPAGRGVASLDDLESYETEMEARRAAAAWAESHGITVVSAHDPRHKEMEIP